MHKDPGKLPPKPQRAQPVSNRAGSAKTEGRSWFGRGSQKAAAKTTTGGKDVQIRSISASTPTLTSSTNNNNNNNESSNNKKVKRPLSSNITVRRGQQQQSNKIESQTPEDLSRSSSVTNLNVEQKKGAKPKKAESKDKLDKLSGNEKKQHDRNNRSSLMTTRNNNRELEESHDAAALSSEVEILQKQLAQMANDKTTLALQLGEQTGQLHQLQNEMDKLKSLHEESAMKLEQLSEENTVLRNRLRDVAHSPLSDSEKQQLLYESHRHHSSAPASIATNLLDDGGDITACPTPEWDKHSSSNVSEVSVACLQDKINQMQETHYSTNEELQATLQELTDLQKQLTELQQENLRLSDEKNLMFESLCRQTERLNDSRNEVESLKQLLYKDESGQFETAAEREQKLVDLLKSAQEEREALLMKQEQLGNDLEDSRSANLRHNDEIAQLSERVRTLESTLDAKHAEHKLLDQELALAKDQSSSRQIEINRLKDLLENARTKINELEQDRALSDKSELDELLDNARKEKDALESEVAHLKEQLALSKNETEKLKEQVSILQEECKVIRNNAKTTQSDLEYKVEKLLKEKNALSEQLQQFQEAVNELQVQAQCQLDDKRQLSAVLSETQRNLNESERKIVALESELSELKRVKLEQEEEWEKFQNDLLTSVRVANDFKTEAQQDLQRLIVENKTSRERIKQLEAQVEKLNKGGRRRASSKNKKRTLTVEDNLMNSLNRRYKEIEDLPEERLTEEQKAVKVLKRHYETEKMKPVARKSKDKLAISKPSLDSVISDPKLVKIVNDPKLKNVEVSEFYFSEDEDVKSKLRTRGKVRSDTIFLSPPPQEMARSRSLNDLNKENEAEEVSSLKRYDSCENLLVLPSPVKEDNVVTLDTLEEICNRIAPGTPEYRLTKEERLALRLREFFRNADRKVTLKKNAKLLRKKPVISKPTKESVEKNAKLVDILGNPEIKSVMPDPEEIMKRVKYKPLKRGGKERYSMPPIPSPSATRQEYAVNPPPKSKSYSDITFSFNTINMYSEPEERSSLEFKEEVLPPEEFRDVTRSTEPVLTTFQANTFKKEHNYLDDNEEQQKKESEDFDKYDYIEEEQETATEESQYEEEEEMSRVQNKYFVEEASKEESYDESIDSTDFKENFEEVYNEALLRRLENEETVFYDLDVDVRKARTGARKRFSKVIEEIRERYRSECEEDSDVEGKFKEPSDKEDWDDSTSILAVPFVKIEDTDWEEVKLSEDDGKLKKLDEYEDVVYNSRSNQDELLIKDDIKQTKEEVVLPVELKEEIARDSSDEKKATIGTFYETDFPIGVEETDFLKDDEQSEQRKSVENMEHLEEVVQKHADNIILNAKEDKDDGENVFKVLTDDSDSNNEENLTSMEDGFKNKSGKIIHHDSLEKDSEKEEIDGSSKLVEVNEEKDESKTLSDENPYKCKIVEFQEKNKYFMNKDLSEKAETKFPEEEIEKSLEENVDNSAKDDGTEMQENPSNISETDADICKIVVTKDEENNSHDNTGKIPKQEVKKILTRKDAAEIATDNTEPQILLEEQVEKSLEEKCPREQDKDISDEENSNELTKKEETDPEEHSLELLTTDEKELLKKIPKDRSSRPVSEIKTEDLLLVEKLKEKYLKDTDESEQEEEEEEHIFPQILAPVTKPNETKSYEPVYANLTVIPSRFSFDNEKYTPIASGKKPIALPRSNTVTGSKTNESNNDAIYRDFSGQVRKTRFSITYQQKEIDPSYKENKDEKKARVKDLREVFERKSMNTTSDLSSSVSKTSEKRNS